MGDQIERRKELNLSDELEGSFGLPKNTPNHITLSDLENVENNAAFSLEDPNSEGQIESLQETHLGEYTNDDDPRRENETTSLLNTNYDNAAISIGTARAVDDVGSVGNTSSSELKRSNNAAISRTKL